MNNARKNNLASVYDKFTWQDVFNPRTLLCLNNHKYFMLIGIMRFLLVFYVQTYYVPDEYWQSLEVAHKMVYG